MSLHLDAAPGEIAPGVLLPGDPLRARHVARTLLEHPRCHNRRRAAYGYSGTWRGKRVSVQATGMGCPSMLIYAHELIEEYGARRLIRIGTCGALRPELKLGDLVLAVGACTDSSLNRHTFAGMDYAPIADFALLLAAHEAAVRLGLTVHAGNVLTCDRFYWEGGIPPIWAGHGVLAAEMETAALYTCAARHGVQALAILTVSDIIGGAGCMPPEQRERSLLAMAQLALEIA